MRVVANLKTEPILHVIKITQNRTPFYTKINTRIQESGPILPFAPLVVPGSGRRGCVVVIYLYIVIKTGA